ncbi:MULTISPECIES: hypothetical protein [Burkholderia]|uniref:hypothetical protein n=1 Tax=Burkholderia TaxID=32008 RepID=UPI0014210B84|nr:hypothetical protein [Burkholderia sp. D-99]NHV28427.1 hypothetical protein [Burkholderia sp. D-99]HKT62920.1 hypothetical protein [Burkholderia sp.]
MKILVDRYMASVGSKHRATTIRPACAAMTPHAARWISSEMAQKQHAAPRATALLEFQQNDGKTEAQLRAASLPFQRQPVAGRGEAQVGTPFANPRSRAADPRRHRPDARRRAGPPA